MSTDPALAPTRTPDRPGPGPTPDTILRALDLSIQRRVHGMLVGAWPSVAQGHGAELAQVRRYQPGDDVRRIDWNATARTGETHVRVDVAERALTTWLLLDTSPSMTFGTADRRKADVAEGVALAIGYVATRGGNRLGVLTFGGRSRRTLPPRHGAIARLGLLTTLRQELEPDGAGATLLGETFAHVERLVRRPGLLVVVSDFRGPRDWQALLLRLAGRHDVLAVEVRDPREQELPDIGELSLVDPETGRHLRVDTASRRLREGFAAAAAAERDELARVLRSAGVDHVVLSTAGDWLRPLAAFFRLRGRRGARR